MLYFKGQEDFLAFFILAPMHDICATALNENLKTITISLFCCHIISISNGWHDLCSSFY